MHMIHSEKTNASWITAVRNSRFAVAFNRFCASPWFLACLGALTLLTYAFALELYFYGLVLLFVFCVCLFCDDFLSILPLFIFCYISPSSKNNPGKAETSVFYGAGGITILILAGFAVVALMLRIATDKNMGFKKLFTKKRSLLIGFLVLGGAYLLSGIGSDHYTEIVWKNLFFALLQFLSLFLLYFLFSATIQWKNVDKRYFAWIAVIFSLTVVGELVHVYFTQNVIMDKVIKDTVIGKTILRAHIYTGWGMYNNVGALIALGIPLAWYLAVSYRHGYLLIIPASLFVLATVFSCSRGSMLGAVLAFLVSIVYACIKSKHRISLLITTFSIACLCGGMFFWVQKSLPYLFESTPDLFNLDNLFAIDSFKDFLLLFNDSNRFSTYKEGFKVFKQYPIFGDSFYPSDFTPWDFSELDEFSSFFPPRWHNTIVQILVSCGSVGLIAYLFHRVQTILLFTKKRTLEKTFIGFSVLVLLFMSLLDCHFFNIGPAFFYSSALLFAENMEKKPTESLEKTEKDED